jgi:hypothetical protein
MALLEKFGDKRIMIDGLKIDGKIWDALAQTINSFEGKQVRSVYIKNTPLDDKYFPELLREMRHREEFKSLMLEKLVIGPNSAEMIVQLLSKHTGIREFKIIDCDF